MPPTELLIHSAVTGHYPGRVPPFGYSRLNAYLQLPVTFRSLSRPSSAISALASTLRSYSLDLCQPPFTLLRLLGELRSLFRFFSDFSDFVFSSLPVQFSRCVEGISRSFKTIQRSRRASSEQFLFRAVSDPGQSLRLSASSHPLTRFRFVFLLLRPHPSRNSDVRPRILSSTLRTPRFSLERR